MDPELKNKVKHENVDMLNKLLLVVCRDNRYASASRKRKSKSKKLDLSPLRKLDERIRDKSNESMRAQRSQTDQVSVIPERSEPSDQVSFTKSTTRAMVRNALK